MWIEKILDPRELGDRRIDYLDLPWDACRPVLKRRTRAGRDVCLLLSHGQIPRHGDLLHLDEASAIVVNVLPVECVVAGPANADLLLRGALELGNLHLPTQIAEGALIFPADDRAVTILQDIGLALRREQRRFEPTPVAAIASPRLSASLQILRGSAPASAAQSVSRSA